MTADKEQAGYGPWIPQWGGEPTDPPRSGTGEPRGGPPQHWGHRRSQTEAGDSHHRGPWGRRDQWDRQAPWSHGEHDPRGPRSAAPQYGWGYGGGPEQQQQQRWQDHDSGRCRWRHGDQQGTTPGPSWATVALTGAGLFGLYQLLQGNRRRQ